MGLRQRRRPAPSSFVGRGAPWSGPTPPFRRVSYFPADEGLARRRELRPSLSLSYLRRRVLGLTGDIAEEGTWTDVRGVGLGGSCPKLESAGALPRPNLSIGNRRRRLRSRPSPSRNTPVKQCRERLVEPDRRCFVVAALVERPSRAEATAWPALAEAPSGWIELRGAEGDKAAPSPTTSNRGDGRRSDDAATARGACWQRGPSISVDPSARGLGQGGPRRWGFARDGLSN